MAWTNPHICRVRPQGIHPYLRCVFQLVAGAWAAWTGIWHLTPRYFPGCTSEQTCAIIPLMFWVSRGVYDPAGWNVPLYGFPRPNLGPRSHRTHRCSQMLHAKMATYSCHWECSHSIASNITGFACKFSRKRAYAFCPMWTGPWTLVCLCKTTNFSHALSWSEIPFTWMTVSGNPLTCSCTELHFNAAPLLKQTIPLTTLQASLLSPKSGETGATR